MSESHKLEITESEWAAFCKDFDDTMAKFNVPVAEHKELFAIVGEHQGRHCRRTIVFVTTVDYRSKECFRGSCRAGVDGRSWSHGPWRPALCAWPSLPGTLFSGLEGRQPPPRFRTIAHFGYFARAIKHMRFPAQTRESPHFPASTRAIVKPF
jgi:hypothetical protein